MTCQKMPMRGKKINAHSHFGTLKCMWSHILLWALVRMITPKKSNSYGLPSNYNLHSSMFKSTRALNKIKWHTTLSKVLQFSWNASSSRCHKEKINCWRCSLTMLHKMKPSLLQLKEFDEGAWLWHMVAKNNKNVINFQLTNFDFEWIIFNPTTHI
jgi:hypothetical protein